MAAYTLVGRELRSGEQLLKELDKDHLPITAAFWCYPTAEADGRLVIASPMVDVQGTLAVYGCIQEAADRLPDSGLTPSNVYAVGDRDPVVRRLRQIRPADFAPDQVTMRFVDYVPYTSYLDESELSVSLYVYRLTPEAGDHSDGTKGGGPGV